jgi:hypothetical protein
MDPPPSRCDTPAYSTRSRRSERRLGHASNGGGVGFFRRSGRSDIPTRFKVTDAAFQPTIEPMSGSWRQEVGSSISALSRETRSATCL